MPIYIDTFVAVLRDNSAAQVATVAVFILMLLDIIFGTINACFHGDYASEIMRKGLLKKCALFGVMIVCVIIDGLFIANIEVLQVFREILEKLGMPTTQSPVFLVACLLIVAMEIGSLLETFVVMNPELVDSSLFKILATAKQVASQVADQIIDTDTENKDAPTGFYDTK